MGKVFASEVGWRGTEDELVDGKCPRSGKPVKETSSPELRIKAYAKFLKALEEAEKKGETLDYDEWIAQGKGSAKAEAKADVKAEVGEGVK